MKEKILENYCKKKEYCNCISECNNIFKKKTLNDNCCYLKRLNLSQIDYLSEESDRNIYLNACPGSGKTEILAIKVSKEIVDWQGKNNGIAVLTFTNSAENEVKNRINEFIDINNIYPHFIGTFTSWLHGYIANPFLYKLLKYEGINGADKSIRVIDNDNNSSFLNSYTTKYSYKQFGKIRANDFYYSKKYNRYIYCGKMRGGNEVFAQLLKEEWIKLELEQIKNKFYQKGFCLYEDVENLVFDLLNTNKEILNIIAKRFPIIFIDECQDLSYIQLEILRLLLENNVKIHMIGDLNQSIYEFRIIEVEDINKFIKDNNFFEMKLNENYRSCSEIVKLSNYVVNNSEEILAHGNPVVKKPLKLLVYEKSDLKDVINKFLNISENNCIDKEKCKVIVRGNNLKGEIKGKVENKSINTIEKLADSIYWFVNYKTLDQLKYAILSMAMFLQRAFFYEEECHGKNNYYRPESIDIIKWKKMIFDVREIFLDNKDILDFNIEVKKWKEKIKSILESKSITELLEGNKLNMGKIRSGTTDSKVIDLIEYKLKENSDIHIETIHNCKGMSIDSVLLFTPKSSNSDFYWRKWIDITKIGEENRFAYVAISRAKYLFVLAIPKDKNYTVEYKKKFEDLGFEIL